MTPESENIFMVRISIGEPLGAGTGTISAKGFEAEEAEQLSGELSSRFLVKVDDDAAGCCIDGRNCIHTLGETAPIPGPSISGGPSVTSYAAAEMVGEYFGDKSAPTSLGRVEEVNQILVSGGIVLGAHVSDGAVRNGFVNPETNVSQTGCGANDEFKSILNKPADDKTFVDTTTGQLLGDAYNPNYTKYVEKDVLQNRVKDYDSHDVLDVVAAHDEGRNVEILAGKHAEVLVVFNYVEGTTIDRDALVAETGKQVFVVDMWYLDKLATAMAAGRPDAVEMQQKLKHAMTAFQVSTYLALCDGTHRPVILKPELEPALSATR